MQEMDRNEAIRKILAFTLPRLDSETRVSYILDWWGIDEEDNEFSCLSLALQHKILMHDDIPDDTDNPMYDELIQIALYDQYRGTTNTYLSEQMIILGLGRYKVRGEIEELEICPCCNYKTLTTKGEYEVCCLCGWEDNGVTDVTIYSSPNHMTLGDARKKFELVMNELPLNKWVKA